MGVVNDVTLFGGSYREVAWYTGNELGPFSQRKLDQVFWVEDFASLGSMFVEFVLLGLGFNVYSFEHGH